MVDTPDILMHGQSPMKHSQQVARRDETVESIKHALAAKGIDSKQSFAFIGFDENGNIRVHASGQVKGFLDEHRMESGFQEAYEKAVHESFIEPEPTSISIDEDQGSDYGDDEFPTVPRTFSMPQSRVYRIPRQRGEREQSMLPCDASRHGPTEPMAEPQCVREVSLSEPEEEVVVPKKKMSRIMRVDDTDQVVDFLKTRLKRMQQLAVKKIAKAWIKGICPKKQAKFPYQNKKCEEIDGFKPRIPGWWPKSGCRFTEPDHIKREERMTLCIHLLRLRPTPAQLKIWNEDKSEPHPTHVTKGWTAFLEELAGVSIFDDLQKEDKKKTESKKELLKELYHVAGWEESFEIGELDGDATHDWCEDEEERRTVLTKRPHQDPIDFKIESTSRQSSESVECRLAKRCRRKSILDEDLKAPQITLPSNRDDIEPLSSEDAQHEEESTTFLHTGSPQFIDHHSSPAENFVHHSHVDEQFTAVPMKRDSSADSRWRHFEPSRGGWAENPVAANPFGTPNSQFSMPNNFHGGPSGPPSLHDQQGYSHPHQPEHARMVQVHRVSHVPEPHFQAVQNVPIYSPEVMMPAPLSSFMHSEYTAPMPSQPYPTTMAPTQYFMPANPDPMVGDFHGHPPAQHQYDQHGLAERHITPMQVHGLPFTQPSNWQGGPFSGQCHNQA